MVTAFIVIQQGGARKRAEARRPKAKPAPKVQATAAAAVAATSSAESQTVVVGNPITADETSARPGAAPTGIVVEGAGFHRKL